MANFSRLDIFNKLMKCKLQLNDLLSKIKEIEESLELSENSKIDQIEIIRSEIAKIAQEIDGIKKEINLLDGFRVN